MRCLRTKYMIHKSGNNAVIGLEHHQSLLLKSWTWDSIGQSRL